MAAEQGHSRSALEVGRIYLKGGGVALEGANDGDIQREGMKWLHTASELGSEAAALELGRLYCAGLDLNDAVVIEADVEKGRDFLEQATKLGVEEVALEAGNDLGDLYVKGPGNPRLMLLINKCH